MSNINHGLNPLGFLSELSQTVEDAVIKCEQLHLDRVGVFYTAQEFDKVCEDCQRLHSAANKLSTLVKERKSEMSKIAMEQQQDSFRKYTTEAVQRMKDMELNTAPKEVEIKSVEEFNRHTSLRSVLQKNIVEIFRDQQPNDRSAILRNTLTHRGILMWCICFQRQKWLAWYCSEELFKKLVKWIQEQEFPKLIWLDINQLLLTAKRSSPWLRDSKEYDSWLMGTEFAV